MFNPFGQSRPTPGEVLRKRGATPVNPIILIPGFVSTGLELWEGKECADGRFREKMWGGISMIKSLISSPSCWLEHMFLNSSSTSFGSSDNPRGVDPDGIKLRAEGGYNAPPVPGYWVWDILIQELGKVGYDPLNMQMMPYDWRLSFGQMQQRDGYMYRLKRKVEEMKRTSGGRKVVLTGHSYGANLAFYFFNWVEKEHRKELEERNVDSVYTSWTDEYIDSVVNIAGPLLGSPKCVSACMSGEVKDTAELVPVLQDLLDKILSKSVRIDLLRSWGSMGVLLPKGGEAIWGNGKWRPDQMNCVPKPGSTFTKHLGNDCRPGQESGDMIRFSNEVAKLHENANTDGVKAENISAKELFEVVWNTGGIFDKIDHPSKAKYRDFYHFLEKYLSFGHTTSMEELERHKSDEKYWSNVLDTPLPNAASMKIYCLYGVGLDTERGYFYDNVIPKRSGLLSPYDHHPSLLASIDRAVFHDDGVKYGIEKGNGDGTVPLISLGYMCAKGWRGTKDGKKSLLNPSGTKSIIREYPHFPVPITTDVRGDHKSGDHVDIMGNYEMIEDIIKIITRFDVENTDKDVVSSNIHEISDNVPLNYYDY
eukprot:Nk52_evm75s212 gene=Nk52_evmTU75s212